MFEFNLAVSDTNQWICLSFTSMHLSHGGAGGFHVGKHLGGR